jgi:hypothetical protein
LLQLGGSVAFRNILTRNSSLIETQRQSS